MKKTILNLATIAIMSIVLFGCRKNDVIENPLDSFETFKAANQSNVQVFTINTAISNTITGKRGTKITFPPNSFVNSNNTAFAGDAIIALRESFSKSDWMMDGLSATAQNDILISGGMINVEARRKDNGADLKASPAMGVPNVNLDVVIKAQVPRNAGAVNVDMNLFIPDSIGQGGIPVTTPTAPVLAWANASYYPFGNSPNSYIFQLPKFGWSNCDRLYGQPGAKTTIRVTPNMTSFSGASDLQAMLVYKNINSVITLPPSGAYFESYLNSIPVGSQADVVLIGKSATGKILFKVLPSTTFTALLKIDITPEIVPASTVTAYLNSIN
jgi:hypothetical protein